MWKWWRRRPARPPKGTRPQVRLVCDGLIYDLTDDLVLLPEDDENGCAVWQVYGPAHLALVGTPVITIEHPVPVMTHIKIDLIGGPQGSRFPASGEIT
jgi:hypothetical protein